MQSDKKPIEQTSGVDHLLYKRVEDPKEADACAWVWKDSSHFVPYYFKFPALAPDEVRVRILYSGLCHSDVSTGRNEWEPQDFPVCTGHEVIGEIIMMGSDVNTFKFKVGDKVFVGPLRNCCFKCEQCKRGDDNLCCNMDNLDRFLYGRYFGGFATHIQQPSHHIFHLPEGMDERTAAPIICAGVTCLVPMQRHLFKGAKVGIIGIGGLGHIAIQYGKALGCEVIAFTTSEDKRAECKMLGADDVVVVPKDLSALLNYKDKLDYLVNNLYVIDMPIMEGYLATLKSGGMMIQIGLPPKKQPMKLSWHTLVFKQLALAGTLCGSIKDSQQVIDFSHKHNIKVVTEEYAFEDFPKALNRLENERPHFRCVVNVKDFNDRHFPITK